MNSAGGEGVRCAGLTSGLASAAVIKLELASLVINERSDEQVIVLQEAEGTRRFPIVIGMFEAFAIDRLVQERATERPLTHDLLANVITALDGRLVRVVIDDLKDGTYFAKLVVRRGESETYIDARPSDAVTMALRTGVPVFVAERVMNVAASSP